MFLAKFFKAFGIICLVLAMVLLYQRNNPRRVMFLSTPVKKEIKPQIKRSFPRRLIIKKLNIDLEIFPAKVRGQNWETSSLGVSWLDISPIPGEMGNSIIYGHNWTNLLGNLLKAKPGDTVEIAYQDAPNKIFLIEKTGMVSPNNVSVLSQTGEELLTIYTCAGLFDEKRFVLVASLQNNNIEN